MSGNASEDVFLAAVGGRLQKNINSVSLALLISQMREKPLHILTTASRFLKCTPFEFFVVCFFFFFVFGCRSSPFY